MMEQNKARTWNPGMVADFDHIFKIMRPHFAGREASYVSFLGMPDNGSPFMNCRTKEDWELVCSIHVRM
jgi:hypothetical protein